MAGDRPAYLPRPLEALGALAAFLFVMQAGGWQCTAQMPARPTRFYRQATTACLTAIVLAQMVNLFVCRHPQHCAWHCRCQEQPLLLASLAAEAGLLLAIVYRAGQPPVRHCAAACRCLAVRALRASSLAWLKSPQGRAAEAQSRRSASSSARTF